MTTRIQKLSALVANQIAAGEVVERPASIVKELVENSIDAGAGQIDIDIEQGGLKLIRVRDNGQGIHPEDLPLAFCRHATSKIFDTHDLNQIVTFGFRGEALASIGSVSKLTLISSMKEHPAKQISLSGETISSPEPASHPIGTTVQVAELFFNTPARRKFMRTEKTEFENIDELVKRIALSVGHIGITLKHNHRLIRQYHSINTKFEDSTRISALCGQAFVENALVIEANASGLYLDGWIAKPSYSRSQSDCQYFYVNGRIVRDKLLLHAVRNAYQDVMYRDRYPAYVLFLEIPPNLVDVNVHPTKHEVRFKDGRVVHDFIFHAVHDALKQTHVTCTHQHVMDHNPIKHADHIHNQKPALLPTQNMRAPQTSDIKEQLKLYQVLMTDDQNNHQSNLNPLGFAIGQLHNIYILSQTETGLIIVDMHAAHERILYEKMKSAHASEGLVRQTLMLPISIKVTEQEANRAEDEQLFFQQLGFLVLRISKEMISVREIPQVLKDAPIEQLIRDILADLFQHNQSNRSSESIYQLLSTISCHAAVRAHHKLTIPEMNSLLRQMEQTDHHMQCNHGRPSTVNFSMKELDRLFMRGK